MAVAFVCQIQSQWLVMIFQAVFVCLVFLSVFGFVSPAKQLDVRELQTVPLTTIHSVERFLQNNGVYSHAWAYVLQCDNPVAMRDQWNCLAPVYTLLDRLIPPRVGSIQGVFLQVPQSMCELVNKEREQFNLKRANYASLFLGVQLVAGPKSVGETVTTSNCLKREDKGGVRFPNRITCCDHYQISLPCSMCNQNKFRSSCSWSSRHGTKTILIRRSNWPT